MMGVLYISGRCWCALIIGHACVVFAEGINFAPCVCLVRDDRLRRWKEGNGERHTKPNLATPTCNIHTSYGTTKASCIYMEQTHMHYIRCGRKVEENETNTFIHTYRHNGSGTREDRWMDDGKERWKGS